MQKFISYLAILFIGILLCGNACAASATYTYDALGRVTQVLYDNGTKIVYTYDSAGNITNKTVTCGSGGC